MTLKNLKTCVELRSDNPYEAQAINRASMRSYCARTSGMMPDNSQMLILTREEVPEFIKGVSNDVDISDTDKRTIRKLLVDYLAGKITDEALFSRTANSPRTSL